MIKSVRKLATALSVAGGVVCFAVSGPSAHAVSIEIANSDFSSVTPFFSNVTSFNFSIDLDVFLTPGTAYTNPALNSVDYSVNGTLAPGTPSGFPAFNLVQSLTGAEFYSFGGSLSFEIAGSADLSDGLQFNELVGGAGAFTLDARQVDQGRYHPPIIVLNADGTGQIQTSNNTGGVNPVTMQVVNVNFGEEYITDLTFDPASFTLVAGPIPAPIPLPAALPLLAGAFGIFGFFGWRRRQRAV